MCRCHSFCVQPNPLILPTVHLLTLNPLAMLAFFKHSYSAFSVFTAYIALTAAQPKAVETSTNKMVLLFFFIY